MTATATKPKKPKLTREQRTAEKNRLHAELKALVHRVPQEVVDGSIQVTQEWMHDNHKAAMALRLDPTLGNVKASLNKLELELSFMRAWRDGKRPERERKIDP